MLIKKIIILNEVTKGYGRGELRGLATVEKSGDRAVCRLTVFNLGDIKMGNFVFGVKSQSLRLQKFDLTEKSQNFPLDKDTDVEGVISCVLAYKYTDRAVPLLWGSTDGRKIFEANMTDGFHGETKGDSPHDKAGQPVMQGITGTVPAAQGHAGSGQADEGHGDIFRDPKGQEPCPRDTPTAAESLEYKDYAVAAENFYPADYGINAECRTQNAERRTK